MSLKINNDTANGSATLQASNTATGDVTHILPPFSTELAPRMQLMTAQTASGTAIDFTGIPSWAKRITVIFNGVSTSGTSSIIVQVGTGLGIVTADYIGAATTLDSAVGYSAYSTGFLLLDGVGAATFLCRGVYNLIIDNLSIIETHQLSSNSASAQLFGSGSVSIPQTLDRIRITTVNGTDLFDAGTINILVEG